MKIKVILKDKEIVGETDDLPNKDSSGFWMTANTNRRLFIGIRGNNFEMIEVIE